MAADFGLAFKGEPGTSEPVPFGFGTGSEGSGGVGSDSDWIGNSFCWGDGGGAALIGCSELHY